MDNENNISPQDEKVIYIEPHLNEQLDDHEKACLDGLYNNRGKTQRRLDALCDVLGDGLGARLLKAADKICIQMIRIGIMLNREFHKLIDLLHIATDKRIREKILGMGRAQSFSFTENYFNR